jgi:hypothetical protein
MFVEDPDEVMAEEQMVTDSADSITPSHDRTESTVSSPVTPSSPFGVAVRRSRARLPSTPGHDLAESTPSKTSPSDAGAAVDSSFSPADSDLSVIPHTGANSIKSKVVTERECLEKFAKMSVYLCTF